MEEDSKRKLIFIALIAIVTILGGFYILDSSNRQAKQLLDSYQSPDTLTQDNMVVFDSIYSHHMGNYRVDVMKSTKHDYARLIFRNTEEPDMFTVHVSPMNDLELYESDVIQRFIDVHEHEKVNNYEYTHKPDGTVSREEIVPLTTEFDVCIVHRDIPENGKTVRKAFIKRKKFKNPMFEVLIKLEN